MFNWLKQFLALLRRWLGSNNATRLSVVEALTDEIIKKGRKRKMQHILKKPIKPGYRRKLILTPDAPVDAQGDGKFAHVGIVAGDSTLTYGENSTAEKIEIYVNGDGSLGNKQGQVKVDGHVGEGEAVIVLDLFWEVAHPDATSFSGIEEAEEDELIPAPTE